VAGIVLVLCAVTTVAINPINDHAAELYLTGITIGATIVSIATLLVILY
jgi:hypothetical protein